MDEKDRGALGPDDEDEEETGGEDEIFKRIVPEPRGARVATETPH